MRNLDGAATDEFADDGVAGNQFERLHLLAREAGDGFEKCLDAVVADARVEKTGVGREVFQMCIRDRP